MIVNIYTETETKIKLNAMSRKYELSQSTIAENLMFYFTMYVLRTENGKEKLQNLGKTWFCEMKGTKTSIKPKLDPVNNGLFENNTKAYTNIIYIYFNRKLDQFMDKESLQKFHNDLNKKLQKTKEPNWDYNHFVRTMKRYENRRAEK